MEILRSGVLYFALVFGAGFVLGSIRILWVVPHLGTRMAELMETPIMFVVIIVAAGWVVRRFGLPSTTSIRLAMGCVALGLMLVAEFTRSTARSPVFQDGVVSAAQGEPRASPGL